MANKDDFRDINETNAPRTLGELRELTENRPISQEQFKNLVELGTKRYENETAKKPDPVPDAMPNPNLGNLESEVGSQPVPCINCGTPVPRDIHKEELGYCVDCSHKFYNDYPVVGSPHYDDDGCHECGVCHKHTGPRRGMNGELREPEDHTCFE
jgi:hypothetical protein